MIQWVAEALFKVEEPAPRDGERRRAPVKLLR
jgi:hypothetical protein